MLTTFKKFVDQICYENIAIYGVPIYFRFDEEPQNLYVLILQQTINGKFYIFNNALGGDLFVYKQNDPIYCELEEVLKKYASIHRIKKDIIDVDMDEYIHYRNRIINSNVILY